MAFLNWVSDNPWMTFILALVVGEVIIRCVKYSQGIPDRPDRPDKCPRCKYDFDEAED